MNVIGFMNVLYVGNWMQLCLELEQPQHELLLMFLLNADVLQSLLEIQGFVTQCRCNMVHAVAEVRPVVFKRFSCCAHRSLCWRWMDSLTSLRS